MRIKMKKSGMKILKWLAVSLAIQLLILMALEIMLSYKGVVEVSSVSEPVIRNTSVKLPKGASGVKVSHDGMYAAFMLDSRMHVINLAQKRTVKILSFQTGEITCYRWLPDRHMLIFASKMENDDGGGIRVSTYDVSSDTQKSYPGIKNLPKGAHVTDIELSTLTNITYIKVKLGNDRAMLYGYNIMSNLFYASDLDASAVIRQMVYRDAIVWQDEKGRLHIWDGENKDTRIIHYEAPLALLAIDNQDMAYVGELDSHNNIKKVLVGDPVQNTVDEWRSVDLKEAVSSKNLVVTSDGTILEVDEERSIIRVVEWDRQIEYKGKLIQVLDKHIVCIDRDRLIITAVELW